MNLSNETLQHLRENRDCARKLYDEVSIYAEDTQDPYWINYATAALHEWQRLDYQCRTLEERRLKVLYSRQEGYYHV
jgi:hypothetical protein